MVFANIKIDIFVVVQTLANPRRIWYGTEERDEEDVIDGGSVPE